MSKCIKVPEGIVKIVIQTEPNRKIRVVFVSQIDFAVFAIYELSAEEISSALVKIGDATFLLLQNGKTVPVSHVKS